MRTPIRIRFVGGPWHNLIPVVESVFPTLYTADGANCYRLCECYTGLGTVYYQYVHSSLIVGGHVARRACNEQLATWPISKRKLNTRLRDIKTNRRQVLDN